MRGVFHSSAAGGILQNRIILLLLLSWFRCRIAQLTAIFSIYRRHKVEAATCLLYSSARYPALDPAEARLIYRARFRIENTYQHSRSFKLRTASSSARHYFYLWSFGQFLECLWELLRLVVKIVGASSAFARQDWIADLLVDILSFCC